MKKQFENIKGRLIPSDAVVEDLFVIIERGKAKKKQRNKLLIKRILPAAALVTVLFITMVFSPYIFSDIKGLPVINDKAAGPGSTESVMEFSDLTQFFRGYSGADCFLIVKVTDVQNIENEIGQFENEKIYDRFQLADIKILKTIYTQDDLDIKEIKQVKLPLRALPPLLGTETVSDLRKNGVYILPLNKIDEAYTIGWYYYALFEIDNWGRLHTHSWARELNQFDGKHYSHFVNKIKRITNDKMLMLAFSEHGIFMNQFLVEASVISDAYTKDEDIEIDGAGNEYNSISYYDIRITKNLSNEDFPEEITLKFKYHNDIKFNKESNYLILLYKNKEDGGIYLSGAFNILPP